MSISVSFHFFSNLFIYSISAHFHCISIPFPFLFHFHLHFLNISFHFFPRLFHFHFFHFFSICFFFHSRFFPFPFLSISVCFHFHSMLNLIYIYVYYIYIFLSISFHVVKFLSISMSFHFSLSISCHSPFQFHFFPFRPVCISLLSFHFHFFPFPALLIFISFHFRFFLLPFLSISFHVHFHVFPFFHFHLLPFPFVFMSISFLFRFFFPVPFFSISFFSYLFVSFQFHFHFFPFPFPFRCIFHFSMSILFYFRFFLFFPFGSISISFHLLYLDRLSTCILVQRDVGLSCPLYRILSKSIYPSIHLSIYPSIHPSVHPLKQQSIPLDSLYHSMSYIRCSFCRRPRFTLDYNLDMVYSRCHLHMYCDQPQDTYSCTSNFEEDRPSVFVFLLELMAAHISDGGVSERNTCCKTEKLVKLLSGCSKVYDILALIIVWACRNPDVFGYFFDRFPLCQVSAVLALVWEGVHCATSQLVQASRAVLFADGSCLNLMSSFLALRAAWKLQSCLELNCKCYNMSLSEHDAQDLNILWSHTWLPFGLASGSRSTNVSQSKDFFYSK